MTILFLRYLKIKMFDLVNNNNDYNKQAHIKDGARQEFY